MPTRAERVGSEGYAAELALALPPEPTEDEVEHQYESLRLALQQYEDVIEPPLTVVLTRRSSRALDATVLMSALDSCRDAMVDVLGVPCDHAEVDWVYRQASGEDALLVRVQPGRASV